MGGLLPFPRTGCVPHASAIIPGTPARLHTYISSPEMKDASQTLVLHCAASLAIAVSPRPGRAGTGRGAPLSHRAANRGIHLQRHDRGGSALRRAARQGRGGAEEGGVPRYATREAA